MDIPKNGAAFGLLNKRPPQKESKRIKKRCHRNQFEAEEKPSQSSSKLHKSRGNSLIVLKNLMFSEGLWKSLRLQGKFLEDLHEVLHHSLVLGVKAAPKLRPKKSQQPFLDLLFILGPN